MNEQNKGKKYDGGKLRYDLLPPEALKAVVEVLTFGAQKYGDHNWKLVENASSRYYAALMRHVEAWRTGETLDSETGISHLAHATCCLFFLLGLEEKSK